MQHQRPNRRRRLGIGLAIVLVAVAVAAVGIELSLGSPTVPSGAASTPIATVKNNSTAATFTDPADPASGGGPLVRRACLDRVAGSGGWLDLCWTVGRMTNETDPNRDTYILRVAGTLHGGGFPAGARWAVLRAAADPASAPFQVLDAWPPTAVAEGACTQVSMTLGFYGAETDTLCGRTAGTRDPAAPTTAGLQWTCAGCLLPLSGDQPIVLAVEVGVGEGMTPIWDLYADLGS